MRFRQLLASLLLPMLALGCDSVAPSAIAPTSFLKSIGGPLDDVVHAARQTVDGGYILVGSTRSEGVGGEDVYVVKLSAEGAVEWTRAYGGGGDDVGRAVLEIEDGYLVVGHSNSGEFTIGSLDAYALRLDRAGDTLWTRVVGGSGLDEATAVAEAHGGGYLVAGRSSSPFSPGTSTNDPLLFRLGADGSLAWARTLVGSPSESVNGIARLADGYALAGRADSVATIWRTNANGERSGSERKMLTVDGAFTGVVALGGSRVGVTGYQRPKDGEQSQTALVLVDVDVTRSGAIQADSAHVVRQGGGCGGAALTMASDGAPVAIGFSNGYGRNADLFLVKSDRSLSTVAWSRAYGGSRDDVGRAIVATRDGGFLLAGTSESFVDGRNGRDILVVKVDANGELRE